MVKMLDPWVIVAGGVHQLGGTDKANFALVQYLLNRGIPVHVVTHTIDDTLRQRPLLRLHSIPVPANSWLAGERLPSFQGESHKQPFHSTRLLV
jgi:hypothetical protein